MARTRQLVLFESASNQGYIFDTNRRGLAVGASELTRLATTSWVRQALGSLGLAADWNSELATGLLLESSGSSLVVLDATDADEEAAHAHALAQLVTTKVLCDAPGLRLYAGRSDPFDWDLPGTLHAANLESHRVVAEARHRLPDAHTRFQRLPWVAECAESGLPATTFTTVASAPGGFSAPVVAKETARRDGYRRIRDQVVAQLGGSAGTGGKAVGAHVTAVPLARQDDDLDAADAGSDDERWVAVIHADGNGVGQLFLAFDVACGTVHNTNYAEALRGFSVALDEATLASFADAVDDLTAQIDAEADGGDRPTDLVLPIVLAGDDLTCLVTGRRAVRFAATYLRAFSLHTAADRRITSLNGGASGIGAAAGIAVTKAHFPFWQAYRLAEDLCASAKTAKTLGAPVLSVDVHVLFDSTGSDLDHLRQRSTTPAGTTWGGPYVLDTHRVPVTNDPAAASPNRRPDAAQWMAAHDFAELVAAVDLLTSDTTDASRLASTVAHRVRDALYGPPGSLDAVLDDLGAEATSICQVATGTGERVFADDGARQLTRLVDAMTLADLCAGTGGGIERPTSDASSAATTGGAT